MSKAHQKTDRWNLWYLHELILFKAYNFYFPQSSRFQTTLVDYETSGGDASRRPEMMGWGAEIHQARPPHPDWQLSFAPLHAHKIPTSEVIRKPLGCGSFFSVKDTQPLEVWKRAENSILQSNLGRGWPHTIPQCDFPVSWLKVTWTT